MSINNPLISVIVPVYNAESFLDRCINSVLNQKIEDWEVLLIDDGSTDNSLEICKDWSSRDNRIKTFHKANGGVSTARNEGLNNAKGEWLTFLDSDDCLEENCFSECMSIIKNNKLDALQFRLKKVYPDGTIQEHACSDSPVMGFTQYVKSNYFSGCGGGNFFKMHLIKDFNIKFNENLHYLEDAFFNCDVLSHCEHIQRINNHFYLYYYNPNGSDKPKDWDYYIDSIEFGADYKRNHPDTGFLIDGWCTMLAMRYVTLSDKHSYSRLSKAWKKLNISNEYIQNAHRKDIVFFNKVFSIAGIYCASFLTKTISKLYYKYADRQN